MAQTSGPISGLLKGHGPNTIGPKIWAVKRPRPKQIFRNIEYKIRKIQKNWTAKGPMDKNKWTVKRPKPEKKIESKKALAQKENGLLNGQGP